MEEVAAQGSDAGVEHLPLQLKGTVIKGFGRGSKQLGIPTANLPIDPYVEVLTTLPAGVYWGWATIDGGINVYGMAMSVGWNPFFQNTTKTIEIHIMHQFEADFYGVHLRAVALGYIRPEANFPTLDALISAIHADIAFAETQLKTPDAQAIKDCPFLHEVDAAEQARREGEGEGEGAGESQE